jgi:hypothetical protein
LRTALLQAQFIAEWCRTRDADVRFRTERSRESAWINCFAIFASARGAAQESVVHGRRRRDARARHRRRGADARSAYLFDTAPTDPATFLAVAVSFVIAAAAACAGPAWRATTVDPMQALRAD